MDYSLEELARTSDDEAVRAHFDARNLGALRAISAVLAAITLPSFIQGIAKGRPFEAVATGISILLSVAAFYLAKRCETANPARQWMRRHTRPVVITYAAAVFLLFAITTSRSGMVSIAFTVPLMMLAFRMLPAELIVLHTSLAVIAIGRAIFSPLSAPDTAPLLTAAIVMNAIALGFEAIASSRWRRRIVADWTGRRAEARDRLRMLEEFRYAREIQLSMLPEGEPQLDWVEVAGVSLPANEVGGDYYDYFRVDGRLAIVSGDVAGHGLACGIVLASIRSGFTLLRDALIDPAAVLEKLHTMIADTSRRRTLVTCAVVLLDPHKRRASLASAGHPPVIHQRNGAGSELVDIWAPPLGVRLPLAIGHAEVEFSSGDIFVLHTDGIYEARNGFGDSYGIERLQEAIEEARDGSAAAIRDAIVKDVERFRSGEPQDDDITLVVAKIR